MLVFLQTLLMLRAALVEWLLRRLRGADTAAEDSQDEDQVTAQYDDERGVVFYPPVYAQRYAAVSDLLCDRRWCGRLGKVVDLGYHDTSFIKYLKEVPGVRTILGVDLDHAPLAPDLFECEEYTTKREDPLSVILFHGNAADPDYRLIGCDAVVAIELIEHMLPHDLERLIHTVFGFIRPWVAIFTTPNADFNVLFKTMLPNGFRHWEHHFEWTREQFHEWCSNIVSRYPQYTVDSQGVGPGPPDTAHLGCCTQLGLFVNKNYEKRADLTPDALALVTKMSKAGIEAGELNCSTATVRRFSDKAKQLMADTKPESLLYTQEVIGELKHLMQMLNLSRRDQLSQNDTIWNNINWGEDAPYWNQYYTIVREYEYPVQNKSNNQRIMDLVTDEIHRTVDAVDEDEWFFEQGRLIIPIEQLMPVVKYFTEDMDSVRELLEWNGYSIEDNSVVYTRIVSDDEESKTVEWHDTDADVT